MDSIRRIYGITSVLFLVVLAISPFKDRFREWRTVQKDFNRVVESLPQKVKPTPISLQQIWVKELGRIDRCVTCHLGVTNRALADVSQPYRTHPRMHHDVDKLGCTICHEGQGWATDYDGAHLASEFWDRPVLPKKHLESACGRCHGPVHAENMPTLFRGRRLVEELNCMACHELPYANKKFAPSLDGIGSKVPGREWLVLWLRDPASVQSRTRMPNFLLSDEQVGVLADFLMSFKRFPDDARLDSLPQVYRQRSNEGDFVDLGKTRFREARCISCHAVDGRGGHLATDLGKIASKATAVWIFNYIRNPKRLQPGVPMPQYGFTVEEAAAVTAYMASEFVDWEARETPAGDHVPLASFYERGLEVFNQYGCGGCHALSSPGVVENRGPELTAVGSKRTYQIDFGTTNISRTLYDYIDAKLASPRSFGENTRMPVFNIGESDREAITTYLLSLRRESLPLEYLHREPELVDYEPQGLVGSIIEKYSCLTCHSIRGTGGTIAPDLSIVGSQIQRDWVEAYFGLPYSLRPIVEERMPNLFASADEVASLVDYFYAALVENEVSLPRSLDVSSEAIERGEALFWEKYGCQSCHIIGAKGGYVGPPLDRTGERLQPGWVFHWLMNPQKYKPDTLEPRSGVSEEEAMYLVAYLTSLRREMKQ